MADATLRFKSLRQAGEWATGSLAPLVREIVLAAAAYALARWSWRFIVTCIYRTPEEDRALSGHGVHPAWRAVDIRTRDISPEAVKDVTEWINARFVYDPERPEMPVAYSEPHGNEIHLHTQIHPNTLQRNPARS